MTSCCGDMTGLTTNWLRSADPHRGRRRFRAFSRYFTSSARRLQAWTGDVRLRVHLLTREMLHDVENEASARASMGLLLLILSKGGRSALEMIRPIVQEKVVSMYAKPDYQSERFLPRLMLMLDDFSLEPRGGGHEERHTLLERRAVQRGKRVLGVRRAKKRGLRSWMRGMLANEIARAGVERDRSALKRAVDLYNAAS